jgi:hypothetical protein
MILMTLPMRKRNKNKKKHTEKKTTNGLMLNDIGN